MMLWTQHADVFESIDTGATGAIRLGGNVLDATWPLPASTAEALLVAWSGTLADELFEDHPGTWGRAGHEALVERCKNLAVQLTQRQQTLCFQPHVRHVLNDVQSSFSFIRDHEDDPFAIAFSPTSLLVPSMVDHIEDHLTRAFAILGPRCRMVILEDGRVDASSDLLQPTALGTGVLPGPLVQRLFESHVPGHTPIIVSAPDFTAPRPSDWDWIPSACETGANPVQ